MWLYWSIWSLHIASALAKPGRKENRCNGDSPCSSVNCVEFAFIDSVTNIIQDT